MTLDDLGQNHKWANISLTVDLWQFGIKIEQKNQDLWLNFIAKNSKPVDRPRSYDIFIFLIHRIPTNKNDLEDDVNVTDKR